MQIISHRGLWKKTSEKNSLNSFKNSFSLGFGVETDIRDLDGALVISHDPPRKTDKPVTLDEFFECYKSYAKNDTLALNVKSDGLATLIKEKLIEFEINNYFVFDMSVPDNVSYSRNMIKFFTRMSDFEKVPSLYEHSTGVLLDEFEKHWVNLETVVKLLKDEKKICIISPELHGRTYTQEWGNYKSFLKDISTEDQKKVIICTDLPSEAKEFFNA